MTTTKIGKVLRLAVSEDKLGHTLMADVAAYRAGREAYEAGMTCDDMREHTGSSDVWYAAVDGYYDAEEGKAPRVF